MASWLLTIDKEHPQHWGYALRAGLWDMRTVRRIRTGDSVFFWQSRGSLLGKVRAIEDAWDLDTETVEAGPWDDWPGSDGKPYQARLAFEVLASSSVAQPTWSEVQEATGLKQTPSWVRTLTPGQAAALDALVGGTLTPQQALDDEQRERVMSDLDEDLRVRRVQLVALRQGQPKFRSSLIAAYHGRCAVSGTDVESVLQAAHISSFKGEHTNKVRNGLLLRADLHTLFDLFLLAITPDDFRVRVSPSLSTTEYADLEGTQIFVPSATSDRPEYEALIRHNTECAWFTT